MAVERVERLLQDLTDALNAAGIPYAIIGGNAVAAWVSTVDEAATRSTKDVDVLVRRDDLPRVTEALRPVDLTPVEVLGVTMFLTWENPNPKTGVNVVFAGERVRPEHTHAAPDTSDSVESDAGFKVVALRYLVQMKLQAYRFIDRAHVQDLLDVGLIDQRIRGALPDDLRRRLEAVEACNDSQV
ncbi:MAG: hypothetical protein PVI86_20235 [Phycisphaerae bacterium]|jgi:hypothetical protein